MTSIYSPGYHIFFRPATALFKARVNMAGAIAYPATKLIYDGVTLGAYGDLRPDMTLALGTTEGTRDLGIARVQNLATSTEIPLGLVSRGTEHGTLDIQDNAYITVYDNYEPWAKLPKMVIDPETGEDITTYKDSDVPVSDYMTELPPVSNPGPFFADYIDDTTDLITVTLPMNGVDVSFAMAEGATITAYAWNIKDGTLTAGTLTSASITATFPAGERWVELTVTDSNGKTFTSRTYVLAVDPAADVTYKAIASVTFNMTQQGQTVDIELNEPLDRDTYPDGFLTLIWKDAPSGPGDRGHMKFVGWERTEDLSIVSSKKGFGRSTKIRCADLAHCLDLLPGFPQGLERPDVGVAAAWEYMPDLTFNRFLWYIYFWHCTGEVISDLILAGTPASYPFMTLTALGSTIYDQMNTLARKRVPRCIVTCNPEGQLVVQEDWMEKNVGDRPAVGYILDQDDISNVSANYNRFPRTHVLTTGAFVTTEEWLYVGGAKDLPTVYSRAPGDVFSQGTSEAVEGEGLALSQSDLNVATGHRYARMNARFEPFRIELPEHFDFWDIAPARFLRVQLTMPEAYQAQRELGWTTAEGMVRELTVRLQGTKRGMVASGSLTWETETEGFVGITHNPEIEGEQEETEVPQPIPTEPPLVLPSTPASVAGIGLDGYVYRTTNFQNATPTWDRVDTTIADTIYSWIVDPFSPGYLNGIGAINGWIANDTAIYRVTDLFGSVTATSVFTFPTATVPASFHWRTIHASFGAYFASGSNPWLACVSYYGSTAGHSGTWVTYSTDGGATWSDEVQISALYAAAPSRFNPIGVYLSPKTPGLGYTVAYGETSSGPLPRFGTKTNGGAFTDQGLRSSFTGYTEATAPPTTSNEQVVFFGPPVDTKRMVVQGTWYATITRTGPSGGAGGGNLQLGDPLAVTRVDDEAYVAPTFGSPSTGSFTATFTFTGGDWPGNRDSMLTSPPTGSSNGCMLEIDSSAQSTGSAGTVVNIVSVDLTITEIELDDGTIYNPSAGSLALFKTTDWGATWTKISGFIEPGEAFGGTLHFPWPNNAAEQIALYGNYDLATNRNFRLKKTVNGTITDISPSDGTRSYGVNRGPFGVRTYDGTNGQQYVLLAGIGNDTSALPADDKHAVYISSNSAGSWTNVVAALADTSAPSNRPAFEAAFGGETEQEVFIWGAVNYMKYSTNFGATLQDKSGNLAALGGSVYFIGIAGGPG